MFQGPDKELIPPSTPPTPPPPTPARIKVFVVLLLAFVGGLPHPLKAHCLFAGEVELKLFLPEDVSWGGG